jgi:hypothetical protein
MRSSLREESLESDLTAFIVSGVIRWSFSMLDNGCVCLRKNSSFIYGYGGVR